MSFYTIQYILTLRKYIYVNIRAQHNRFLCHALAMRDKTYDVNFQKKFSLPEIISYSAHLFYLKNEF